MADAVRTKRTVVRATLKDGAGSAVGMAGATIVPIYDAFNPYQVDMETNPMNRARGTLDPEQFWVGVTTSRLQGNFYVYGIGDATNAYGGMDVDTVGEAVDLLPEWARTFLPAAGMTPVLEDASAPIVYVCFNPASDSQYQIDVDTFLNSYQHVMNGARGNLSFSGQAANPVQVAFDYMGTYGAAGDWQANPDDSAVAPPLPPRLCGVDTFFMRAEGKASAFKPKLKSFSLDLGAQVTQRRNANVDGCVEEFGIYLEYNPRLQVVFEVENFSTILNGTGFSTVEDFIESARQGQRFAFELNVGPWGSSAKGTRFQFRNYNTAPDSPPNTDVDGTPSGSASINDSDSGFPFRMQATRAPQYTDVDGIRCLDCEFLLGGTDDNWMQIVAM